MKTWHDNSISMVRQPRNIFLITKLRNSSIEELTSSNIDQLSGNLKHSDNFISLSHYQFEIFNMLAERNWVWQRYERQRSKMVKEDKWGDKKAIVSMFHVQLGFLGEVVWTTGCYWDCWDGRILYLLFINKQPFKLTKLVYAKFYASVLFWTALCVGVAMAICTKMQHIVSELQQLLLFKCI